MTIRVGEHAMDTSGAAYDVTEELGTGGQGTTFVVRDRRSGSRAIAKVFHDAFHTTDNARRTELLVRMDLGSRTPGVVAPVAMLDGRHGLGTIQPYVGGVTLEALFAQPTYDFAGALGIAAALAGSLAVLEGQHVAHGDVAAANVLVERTIAGVHRARWIDLDNFAAPGAPEPLMRGQDFYSAPEALAGDTRPSMLTDRWSFPVLCHELLLGRHPFAAALPAGTPFREYVRVIGRRTWPDDPALGRGSIEPTAAIVGVALVELFRRAFTREATRRPTLAGWDHALRRAVEDVFECGACMRQFVNDPDSGVCPHCQYAPLWALVVRGRRIALDCGNTKVGRNDLGDRHVSREHAIFRRVGVSLRVRNISRNGLGGRIDGTWRLLPYGEEIELGPGDRMRFAPGVDAEVEVGP